jgi:hypothetical protein
VEVVIAKSQGDFHGRSSSPKERRVGMNGRPAEKDAAYERRKKPIHPQRSVPVAFQDVANPEWPLMAQPSDGSQR